MGLFGRKPEMVNKADALPGRSEAIKVKNSHYVSGHAIEGPFLSNLESAQFATGVRTVERPLSYTR